MSKKSYAEKLKDPRWQRKRLEVFKAYGWQCRKCWSKDKELHVHHLVYDKGAQPWEYDNRDLIPLCVDCHKAADDREALRLFKLYMATTGHSLNQVRRVAEIVVNTGSEILSENHGIHSSLVAAIISDLSAESFTSGFDHGFECPR